MIVVAGEALVDLVIEPGGALTAALGGAPFNTARTCGRLGTDVQFVGAISTDRFGTMLADQLAEDAVGTVHLARVEQPTTLAAAELDDGGAASYRFYIDGTSAPAVEVAVDVDSTVLFTGGLGLVLEPLATSIEAMVDRAAAGGTTMVMVDVNCRPLIISDRQSYMARLERVLGVAHVVKVSDEDLAFMAPGLPTAVAARAVLERGPGAVLLTAGGSSVTVLTAHDEVVVPVDPVDVVDTIGAGDAFGGGFLSWWVEAGLGPEDSVDVGRLADAVRAATQVAGVVCTRRGADPPWRHELPPDWSP